MISFDMLEGVNAVFINKISNPLMKPNFKGYDYEKDVRGNNVLRFNYPYPNSSVEIFKVRKDPKAYAGYYLASKDPILTAQIGDGGVVINPQKDLNLEKGEALAYRISLPGDRKIKDSGMTIEFGYNLVTMNGPKQLVRGSGALVMPDSECPGASFAGFDSENPLEINYDKEYQKKMEQTVRTHSNQFGGNIAGLIYNMPRYKSLGIEVLFSTPIMGADNKSHHHYWNKNNYQIADSMGSLPAYKLFLKEAYRNGIVYVDDITLTSEGLEGNRFQYAKKYWKQDPQGMYLFGIDGIKDNPIAYGVLPKNDKNLRHRVVNSMYKLNEEGTKVIENPKYDSTKPTYYQVYDASQVSEAQLAKDELIEKYENITMDDPTAINTYNDTVIPYAMEIKNHEYKERLEAFLRYNKYADEKITLNSPAGTKLTAQFTDDGFSDEAMGGIELWDANVDMAKLRYSIAMTISKANFAKMTPEEVEQAKIFMKRAVVENIDTAVQTARYRTKLALDTQILYTAQTLGRANALENLNGFKEDGKIKLIEKLDNEQLQNATSKIDKLIADEQLPKRTRVGQEELDLIIRRQNKTLDLKHKLSKDDVTIRALMELPMESLEFGANISEFMTRPFFSNKASRDDRFEPLAENRKVHQIGLTRYELTKLDNPHIVEPYGKTYLKTNLLFKKQIKDFAHKVIEKVNETATEKLLDESGNYTYYGEYVIELLGQDIARYAFLKSLAGDELRAKLYDQNIFYDTPHLRSITTLQGLGIRTSDPIEIAEQIQEKMEKGLDKLGNGDVEFVAQAISNAIKGTTLSDFSVAEAMVKTAGYHQAFRFDAMKDVGNQDAVRFKDEDFRKVWNEVITIMKEVVAGIKGVSEYSGTIAEITDYDDLFKASVGSDADVNSIPNDQGYNITSGNDGMQKIFHETGISTEAAYSHTFTDFLRLFGLDFVDGYPGSISELRSKLLDLVQNKTLDYSRNLYTFADNHDKPSVIHGLALDMNLFLTPLTGAEGIDAGKVDYVRKQALQVLTNSTGESIPIEARLNIANPRYNAGISSKAIAVGSLFRSIINERLGNVATDEEKALLKEAIVYLANGNYLDSGTNLKLNTINLPELSSVQGALKTLLADAGLNLPQDQFDAIVRVANSENLVNEYLVKTDGNYEQIQKAINDSNGEITKPVEELDTYVVCLAGLLVAAFEATRGWDKEGLKNLKSAANRFINKYDYKEVEKNSDPLPLYDTLETKGKKDAFGTRDFEVSIRMLIKQAKHLASQREDLKGKELFKDTDKILVKFFREATEPAVQKALFYMAFLEAFPGIPTVYMRDIYGALGFEEKSKNVHLQNRNASLLSQLEEGPLKEYRTLIYEKFKSILNIRKLEGAGPLNDGTPYIASTSNKDIPAILRQDAKGNMTISLFNITGLSTAYNNLYSLNIHHDGVSYPETLNLENPYIPIQANTPIDYILLDENVRIPENTVFTNLLGTQADGAEYITKIFEGRTYLINKAAHLVREGQNIVAKGASIGINGSTGKYGTMILKHIAHRGRKQTAPKFNAVANAYQIKEENITGQNLSLVAR